MNITNYLILLGEGFSDFPTLLKKILNPRLVSFIMCKNLKSFASSKLASQLTRIIDIGANEGQFAFMARYSWPNVRIDCFEPDPSAFRELMKNHSSDQQIQFYNFAVGSESSEILLNLGETSAQNSLLHEYGKNIKDKTIVPIKKLDDVYADTNLGIILLKVDVQGYELEVLKGATCLLSQINFILIELSLANLFEHGAEIDIVWQFLKNYGFVYHSIIDQYRDPISQRIVQIDVLFENAG
ncbi:MAG: FkbM family methyltransferase [Aphanocapsa sp. GSE-SYN-MK-11-07L]|jgi:FkbM family methyltransferase|nr:FkbM family methyltransferase [Aphanocapsa sp. GSE-SYN-MK-11-07L]